jgi:hypothetical protein
VKKNIIIVGDSFCSNDRYWPTQLAALTERNLICYTDGAGQSWWDARTWLQALDPAQIKKADIMVFAHTNADRIPTDNKKLGTINHSSRSKNELEKSVELYYRHVFHRPFMSWAQQQWFKEIKSLYGRKQLVHLHCFPWTQSYSHLLTGLNITGNLTALSLNELGAQDLTQLFDDQRPNHLNQHNNTELATQLAQLINSGARGNHALDSARFQQATQKWSTDW